MAVRGEQGSSREDVLGIVLLGVTYYVAARLSLRLSLVEHNITPLWPPTGIAFVAFLRRGRRLWPGVALAAFAVNLPISATPLAAAVTAVGNTLAPLLAATLLIRADFHPVMDRLRDAISLVFLGALLSMTVSATIGTVTLVASGTIDAMDVPAAWTVWWAGDAMGILVFAPFLLALPSILQRSFLTGRSGLEVVGLLALVATVGAIAVSLHQPFLFVTLPVIGVAAWRQQHRGAAPAALLVSILATWAAVGHRGPFEGLDIPRAMLTLQGFNASVALTSFVFAAMVAERLESQRALEEIRAGLEERVRARTKELSEANAQLGEAQRIARLGFWSWDLRSGVVTWSDEMYELYGVPAGEPITFERALAAVAPEDRRAIQDNVTGALQARARQLPDIDYRVVHDDGTALLLHGRAQTIVEGDEVVRMVGTVQDVTAQRELEREHRIAETLQRALLPQRLPDLPGVSIASRYVPSEEGSSAGGDWYDVIDLPDGTMALVIGDVAGHGVEAASVMGQVRTAIRSYALEGHSPRTVVGLVHDLLRSTFDGQQMVTMLYVVVDPQTLEARIVNAGHPPPLVLQPGSGATFLQGPTGLPLGLSWDLPYAESLARLRSGSTLVLFTDGLVDRRDISVDDGLDRLQALASQLADAGADGVCGALLDGLVPADASDDVAIVAARFEAARDRFRLRIPADPARLRTMRRSVGRWLSVLDVEPEVAQDVVLACGEACANAIEHAYGPGEGSVEIEATVTRGLLDVIVRDEGRWRPSANGDRGRGLRLMEACMDEVQIERQSTGTSVRMRKALGIGVLV